MRTDRRADTTKLIVALRNFANGSKKNHSFTTSNMAQSLDPQIKTGNTQAIRYDFELLSFTFHAQSVFPLKSMLSLPTKFFVYFAIGHSARNFFVITCLYASLSLVN